MWLQEIAPHLGKLGLAGILATALTGVVACQAAKSDLDIGASVDPVLRVVNSARWAQNAHNIQSWRLWRLGPSTLQGGLDPDRLLPATDPLDRQLILSLGAFTEAARIAARPETLSLHDRWIAPPDWNPAEKPWIPVFEWLFASTLDASTSNGEVPADVKIDALSAASVKYRVTGARLAEGFADGAVARFDRPGVRFAVIERGQELDQVLKLAREAYSIEMTTPSTLMESFHYTVYGPKARARHPYGITLLGNFDRKSVGFYEFLAQLFPQGPADYGRSGIEMFGKAIDRCEQVIVLTTSRNTPEAQYEAGKALQTMWMAALDKGVSLLPMSQGLQEPAQYDAVRKELQALLAGGSETVQMIWAVGKPDGEFLRAPRLSATNLFMPGRPAN